MNITVRNGVGEIVGSGSTRNLASSDVPEKERSSVNQLGSLDHERVDHLDRLFVTQREKPRVRKRVLFPT